MRFLGCSPEGRSHRESSTWIFCGYSLLDTPSAQWHFYENVLVHGSTCSCLVRYIACVSMTHVWVMRDSVLCVGRAAASIYCRWIICTTEWASLYPSQFLCTDGAWLLSTVTRMFFVTWFDLQANVSLFCCLAWHALHGSWWCAAADHWEGDFVMCFSTWFWVPWLFLTINASEESQIVGENGPTLASGMNDERANGSILGGLPMARMAIMVADGQSLFLTWKHVKIQYQGNFGSFNEKVYWIALSLAWMHLILGSFLDLIGYTFFKSR